MNNRTGQVKVAAVRRPDKLRPGDCLPDTAANGDGPSEMTDFNLLLERIIARHQSLQGNTNKRQRFLDHVRSLGHWENDPMDYPEIDRDFPERIPVAFAVCHPDCGAEEFIVDGSTQECQRYRQLMFRRSVRWYKLAEV